MRAAQYQEVRDDPRVGDFGVVACGLLVGMRLGDRLDRKPGRQHGVHPSRQGAPCIRDREGLVTLADLSGCGAEGPSLGDRAFEEVVPDRQRLAPARFVVDPASDRGRRRRVHDGELDEPVRLEHALHLAQGRLRVADVHQAHEGGHEVEGSAGERQRRTVSDDEPDTAAPDCRSGRDERVCDVEGDDVRTPLGEQASVVTLTAAQIESRAVRNRGQHGEERRRVHQVAIDVEPGTRQLCPRPCVGVPHRTSIVVSHDHPVFQVVHHAQRGR